MTSTRQTRRGSLRAGHRGPGARPARHGAARHTPAGRERGAIALELAFLAPVLLLIFALIWAYGRVAWANGHLDAAARDATRVATQQRSLAEAQSAAEAVVAEVTAPVPSCQRSASVRISGAFEPGSTLTVDVSCSYPLDEVGLPGAPGTMHPTATFSSVLDRYRGVDQ